MAGSLPRDVDQGATSNQRDAEATLKAAIDSLPGSQEANDTVTKCYQLYRNQLNQEDALLNQRTTWNVTSQAFLLGTYVFLNNAAEPFLNLPPGDATRVALPGGPTNLTFDAAALVREVAVLKSTFQWVGLFSSLFAFVSSLAAIWALGALIRSYKHSIRHALGGGKGPLREQALTEVLEVHRRVGLPPLVPGPLIRALGLVVPALFGPIFFLAWLRILLTDQGGAVASWATGIVAFVGALIAVLIVLVIAIGNLGEWSENLWPE